MQTSAVLRSPQGKKLTMLPDEAETFSFIKPK